MAQKPLGIGAILLTGRINHAIAAINKIEGSLG